MIFEKQCRWCGKMFFPAAGNARYCGDICRAAALREQRAKYMKNHREALKESGEIIRECKWCGREFKPFQAQKYCCPDCREAATGAPMAGTVKNKKRAKPKMTLAQVAKAAAEAGMTYGEYVRKMEVAG